MLSLEWINSEAPDPSDTFTLKYLTYSKCSKILNIFLILFSNEMMVFKAGISLFACQKSKQERP